VKACSVLVGRSGSCDREDLPQAANPSPPQTSWYGGVLVEKGSFPKIENFSLAYHVLPTTTTERATAMTRPSYSPTGITI
jgi:hypothetical protein